MKTISFVLGLLFICSCFSRKPSEQDNYITAYDQVTKGINSSEPKYRIRDNTPLYDSLGSLSNAPRVLTEFYLLNIQAVHFTDSLLEIINQYDLTIFDPVISGRLMVTEKNGVRLKMILQGFDSFMQRNGITENIYYFPHYDEDELAKIDGAGGWEYYIFDGVPLIVVKTVIEKFQQEINMHEAELLKFWIVNQ